MSSELAQLKVRVSQLTKDWLSSHALQRNQTMSSVVRSMLERMCQTDERRAFQAMIDERIKIFMIQRLGEMKFDREVLHTCSYRYDPEGKTYANGVRMEKCEHKFESFLGKPPVHFRVFGPKVFDADGNELTDVLTPEETSVLASK